MFITTSELCGFGIGFGIGRKYRPITVSVSVSGRNQNGGFGRSLMYIELGLLIERWGGNQSKKTAILRSKIKSFIDGAAD